jgi:tetratricopeptide (TPR) repeat protein
MTVEIVKTDVPPQGPTPSEGPPRGFRPPANRFTGWRGWLLRILLLVVSPFLFFGAVELGLRWFGYGYPTRFFIGPDEQGHYRSNDQYGWRFFPRPLARRPLPQRVTPKPPDTIRIAVLGGSAAMGIPDPAFGFARILSVMLDEQYPDTRFEVINGAMTAINSHVALEIARECVRHDVDVFVIYMGNNEVTGPYGPGTVFQQWSRRLPMVRTAMRVNATRTGQMLSDLINWSRGGPPVIWRGMEMCVENPVAADDPSMPLVYANFRRNVSDILEVARRRDAGVVIATVGVNLHDFPPLASLHRRDLSPDDQSRWEAVYPAGIAAAEFSRDWDQAVALWNKAARIDDRHAELHFRLGRSLAAQGRFDAAVGHFRMANDLDALRFRADSRINELIRDVAAEHAGNRVRLADAEMSLAASATILPGVPGNDLFHDHVHLNFEGAYRVAETVLEQLSPLLPAAVRARRTGPVPSLARCAERLGLTRWDEFHMARWTANSTSRIPFTNQLDHSARQAALFQRVEELYQSATTPEALAEAARIYREALAHWPDDWELHHHLAAVLYRQEQVEEAVDHWRHAARLSPNNIDILHQLAVVLATSPRAEIRNGREAIALTQRAAALAGSEEPMFLDTLAAAYAEAGEFSEAIAIAEQALALANLQRKRDLADTLRSRLRLYRAGSPIPHDDAPPAARNPRAK